MAKVKQNIVIQGLSGSIGGQLVIKIDKSGRTIVSAAPTFDENRQFTEAQQAQHEAFREAAAYAKTAKDNEVYKNKANGTPQNPYNVAMADWFHEPQILEIDTSAWNGGVGEVIRVKAIDDVQVKKVSIVISAADGTVLEQGEATAADSLWWNYTTTAPAAEDAKILATVQDLPGHVVKLEVE